MMDQDEWTDSEDERERISKAFDALSPLEQDILWLADYEGSVTAGSAATVVAFPNPAEFGDCSRAKVLIHRLVKTGALTRGRVVVTRGLMVPAPVRVLTFELAAEWHDEMQRVDPCGEFQPPRQPRTQLARGWRDNNP